MAAILPFLETEQFHFPKELDTGILEAQGLSGLGAGVFPEGLRAEVERQAKIAQSNGEMTRLLWTRTLIQRALSTRTFQLVRKGREFKIRLSEAFVPDTIPWARTASAARTFSFFSTNSKMRCPTFDLPAGAGSVGGACPAAGPAQTTSLGRNDKGGGLLAERDGRKVLRLYPDIGYNLASSVCSSCYATGGKYGEPSVQIREIVAYAVVQAALRDPAIRRTLVEAMVWQIPNLPFDKWEAGKGTKRDATGVDEDGDEAVKPAGAIETPQEVLERMKDYPDVIRVHSSGDFFDLDYARMWLEVANRLYETHGTSIMLWAPTRTQVVPTWAEFWKKNPPPPNFVIRPSGYHVGDPAPDAVNLARGTSVLVPADAAGTKGIKYDHQCGVYDLEKGNKTCVDAMSPPGRNGEKPQKGCRACWVRGDDLRINYVAH